MVRYRKYFPNIGTPYLGRPAGDAPQEHDILELPDETEIVELTKRNSKNVDQLHRLHRVHTIYCSGFLPEWIEQLEQLPNLRHLQVSLSRIKSVPSFQGLKKLRVLVTTRGKEVDWSFLKGVTWLHSLCIGDVKTELPLKHISGISDLRELYIDSGAVIASLNPLKKLTELQFLVLLIKVTRNKPSIRPLSSLKKLTNLQLSPRFEVQDFNYLIERLPNVNTIELNGGLSWPPPGVPVDKLQAKGKPKVRVKVEGNTYSLENDT